MKHAIIAILFGLGLAACGGSIDEPNSKASASSNPGSASDETAPTELVLTNAKVKTPEGWAEALAVSGNKIVAVDDASRILADYPDAPTIDLKGKVVLPGFHDLHVHPIFAGALRDNCVVRQGSDETELRESVASCASRAEPGEWIIGGQWDASTIGKVPTAAMIDAVSPENPVLLNDTSGHSALANSVALKLANVTRDTPNPPGGIIERDENGDPTGVLRELAIGLVRVLVPPPSQEVTREYLDWAIGEMSSYGITSFTEASLGFTAGQENEATAYSVLASEGRIPQRVRICITWQPGSEGAEKVIAERAKYENQNISVDCVKVFLDGVPTDGHTAAMLEPYVPRAPVKNHATRSLGLLLIDPDVLNDAVARFDALGLTVKFHAAGDAAVRAGLDAIEFTRNKNGDSGLRHNVGHCTFISKKDIPRAAKINATFELSPYLWSPSPIGNDIANAIGAPRMKRVWPFKDVLDAGALVVVGSDWAVVPSVNPWIAIESLVTREAMGGSDESFGKDQAISVERAIDLFTKNAAVHKNQDDVLGSIEPGKLADLIVIDQDPYSIPSTDLHKTKVMMTMIDGKAVFEALGVHDAN